MSTPELTVVQGGKKTFRTVEAVRRVETDRWKIVEAIEADVEERLDPRDLAHARSRGHGVHTGFLAICTEIADAIQADGGDRWKDRTVSTLYSVAVAWPQESRVKGATYGAHERLIGRDDRVKRLEKLVERSKTGKVNRNDIDTWLAGLKSRPVVGFLDGVEKAVRAALLAKAKPWNHVAQGDRDEIAMRLRRIAEEVQNAEGKFGG